MTMFQSARFSNKHSASDFKYIIAGLGNPGKKYVDTRHNVGFDMIACIASYYNIKVKKLKCKAITGEGKIGDSGVVLAMPQTYMNLSGESIKGLMSAYNIKPENVIIISDDIALPAGKMRIREKGSAGGHNGLKNIIYQLATDEFPRVRIGVGAPQGDVADYVLNKLTKTDVKIITEIAKAMPDVIDMMINDSVNSAMNKYN